MSSRALLVWVGAGLLGCSACASSPQEESTALADPDPPPFVEPVEEVPPSSEPEPVDEASPEPGDVGASKASEAPASPEPAVTVITGIPVCDEYLSLYRRCEKHLEPQIMAGNRRFYRAEEASVRHFAGTPEAATLPDSCRSMLDALRVDCPAQHRHPPDPSP